MKIKLLILLLTNFLFSISFEQELKIEKLNFFKNDTSSIFRWKCNAGSTVLSKENYPLVIINGKKFKNCLLQNIFFNLDTTMLLTVQILTPENDSIKHFGKAGKNGVIIIKTKSPIEWISAKQIIKQKSKEILCSNKKTLINVDNAFFDTKEELYFQKNLIDNITVANNKTQYYFDKQFNCVVTIRMTKKSST